MAAALAESLLSDGEAARAREVISRELPNLSGDVKLDALITLAKVEGASGRHRTALDTLSDARPEYDATGDDRLRAFFHAMRSALYYELSKIEDSDHFADKAFLEHDAAIDAFQRAGDLEHAGGAENNLALLHGERGNFEEAREHFRRARRCFAGLPVKLAQVDDSESEICVREGRYQQAVILSCNAVRVLAELGERRLLELAKLNLLTAMALDTDEHYRHSSRVTPSGKGVTA